MSEDEKRSIEEAIVAIRAERDRVVELGEDADYEFALEIALRALEQIL